MQSENDGEHRAIRRLASVGPYERLAVRLVLTANRADCSFPRLFQDQPRPSHYCNWSVSASQLIAAIIIIIIASVTIGLELF